MSGGSYDSDILKIEHIHLDAMRLVTGVTARSNIINVHVLKNLVAILLVIACNFNHAFQGFQREGLTVFDKYIS